MTQPNTPVPDRPGRPAMDVVWRVLGGLVGVAGAVVGALLAALYTPLYLNTIRLPLAPLIAVVVNVALVKFTFQVTEHKGAALLPGLAWMGLMIVAAGPTSEGDLLLAANNWVAVATIMAGVLAYTVTAVRLISGRLNQPDPNRFGSGHSGPGQLSGRFGSGQSGRGQSLGEDGPDLAKFGQAR